VILVVGVNGAGKTTSIRQADARLQSEGKSVCMCADTFAPPRSSNWRLGAANRPPISSSSKPARTRARSRSTPSRAAKARKADYVIVDTAGRLHTKTILWPSLEKMRRTVARVILRRARGAARDRGTTGQNGLSRLGNHGTSAVTGIILTKLDGTAKGAS